jgi:hypothetical protein
MTGAGNPLGYDYRDPRHVERYNKLVIRHPTGETEGKHPRDADVDVMREIHEPAPLLRVIRAKCIDCSGGSESEARKCTAMGCAGKTAMRRSFKLFPELRTNREPNQGGQRRDRGRDG